MEILCTPHTSTTRVSWEMEQFIKLQVGYRNEQWLNLAKSPPTEKSSEATYKNGAKLSL